MNKGKILVVDDEEKILMIVKLYLEKDGYEVITSTNGNDVLSLYYKENPILIILDLMLPDLSGEAVCIQIRKSSQVPIIMLTAKVDEQEILTGFDSGADDYVLKPFSPKQLLARIHAILKRSTNITSNQVRFGDLLIDYNLYEVYRNAQKIDLTPIEFKILSLFSNNLNRVFTREEIIQDIYQNDFDGYDRAIDSHIKNLRKKLNDNPPHYILTVHGIGYKFGGGKFD